MISVPKFNSLRRPPALLRVFASTLPVLALRPSTTAVLEARHRVLLLVVPPPVRLLALKVRALATFSTLALR